MNVLNAGIAPHKIGVLSLDMICWAWFGTCRVLSHQDLSDSLLETYTQNKLDILHCLPVARWDLVLCQLVMLREGQEVIDSLLNWLFIMYYIRWGRCKDIPGAFHEVYGACEKQNPTMCVHRIRAAAAWLGPTAAHFWTSHPRCHLQCFYRSYLDVNLILELLRLLHKPLLRGQKQSCHRMKHPCAQPQKQHILPFQNKGQLYGQNTLFFCRMDRKKCHGVSTSVWATPSWPHYLMHCPLWNAWPWVDEHASFTRMNSGSLPSG